MRVINKSGQFFLLAAVVISAVVLSLGLTANQAKIKKEPKDFFDSSQNIGEEAGAVISYLILDPTGGDLQEFINDTAESLRDEDKNIEIVVLNGSYGGVTIQNHGVSNINFECLDENNPLDSGEINGREYEPVWVCLGEPLPCQEVPGPELGAVNLDYCSGVLDKVKIVLDNENHFISFSSDIKIIFIIQKNVEGETYVSA